MKGEITGYFDVAQVAIWLFWIFFVGLLFYLRREDRREGYPLYDEVNDRFGSDKLMFIPKPKTFKLPHGQGTYKAPTGPGAYAERRDVPDPAIDGKPKIVPIRLSHFEVSPRDPDPRGMAVVGADGRSPGTIVDVWVDRSELVIRYLEAEVSGPGGTMRRVMVPMNFTVINGKLRQVKVKALQASQFAGIPALKAPDQITLLEEEKVCAYYGAGTLYAYASRAEPML
jgi:photosynthetic reaction center H subunit